MICLCKSQMILLLSRKDLYVLLGSLLLFLLFLLYACNYYMDYNYLIVYRDVLFRDYLIESISLMKFLIVLYGGYLSMLARKLHLLDGLYLSRSNRTKIIVSRMFVLIVTLILCISILFVLLLTVGTFLTPFMKKYDYFGLYSNIILFGIFYFMLSYLTVYIIKVFYAPLSTLLIYFTGTIFSPYYIEIEETTVFEEIISFVINDLIVFSNYTIAPYYGSFHLLSLIFVMISIVVWLFNVRDIITL